MADEDLEAPGGEAGGHDEPARRPPVVVKKYANRRLYNTETSSYVTLEDLSGMVREGRDFAVFDAKSGDEITRSVLTQIIVEEEGKGASLLPVPFLRQIIGLYGDSMQSLVPRYLEYAMGGFARQQQQVRRAVEQTMGGFPLPAPFPMPGFMPFGLEELGKQNVAMMERAMSLFAPFRPPGEGQAETPPRPAGSAPAPFPAPAPAADAVPSDAVPGAADPALEALRAEVARLEAELAALREAPAPAKPPPARAARRPPPPSPAAPPPRRKR